MFYSSLNSIWLDGGGKVENPTDSNSWIVKTFYRLSFPLSIQKQNYLHTYLGKDDTHIVVDLVSMGGLGK